MSSPLSDAPAEPRPAPARPEAVVRVVEGDATIEDMGHMLLSRPRKMDGWKITLV